MPGDPTLGEFEQLVLLALVRVGEGAYGVPIWAEIRDKTGRDVSLGAVYKTLERLEAKRYLSSWMGEPTADRGGRRKKHYRLEGLGLRTLTASVEAFRRMIDGLETKLEL